MKRKIDERRSTSVKRQRQAATNINKLLCIYNYYRCCQYLCECSFAYLTDTTRLAVRKLFRTCKLNRKSWKKNYFAYSWALSAGSAVGVAVDVAVSHDKALLTESWRPLLIRPVRLKSIYVLLFSWLLYIPSQKGALTIKWSLDLYKDLCF